MQYLLLYREAKLVEAEKVLLTDHHHHQVHEESVIRLVIMVKVFLTTLVQIYVHWFFRLHSELFFVNKKNKYVWDETVQLFRKLRNIDEGLNQSDFFKMQVFGGKMKDRFLLKKWRNEFAGELQTIICTIFGVIYKVYKSN